MYYITNQNSQIIAVDEALLELLGFDRIEGLQKEIAREEVTFDSSTPNQLTINTNTNQYSYECETTVLSSMFGDLSLHIIQTKESTEHDELALADEALAAALLEEEAKEVPLASVEEEHQEALVPLDEEPLSINEEEPEEEGISILGETPEVSEGQESDEEPFSIRGEETEEEGISILDETPEEKREESEEALVPLDEEPFSIMEEESEEEGISILGETPEVSEQKESVEPFSIMEEEGISILDDVAEESKEASDDALISLDEEPFSVIEEEPEASSSMDEEAVSTMEEPEEREEETPMEDTLASKDTGLTPIVIDVKEVSRNIGISTEDYVSFLNEFIDEAISLEKDLQSIDLQKQSEAINTLKQLTGVLHLSEITEAIENIEQSTSEEKVEKIEILYNTLARLTTHSLDEDLLAPNVRPQESTKEELAVEEPMVDLVEEEPTVGLVEEEITAEEPMVGLVEEEVIEPTVTLEAEKETVEEELPEGSFGSLTMEDLDEVKPIHFDFRLEEAADELSLPVELIEEFVNDFLVQAREETVNMLAEYRAGNLDRIQKIGHLLKGASSNLRINPLADTLYEIQFCEDPSQLEGLIKNYWAHFISFEKQIKMTSN